MKLYNIKNSYIYDRRDDGRTHRYLVYKDRRTRELRIIQLTHLYEIPRNKMNRLRNGNIYEYKFKFYKLPSGVESGYRTKDINGNPIVLTRDNSTYVRKISRRVASKIKRRSTNRFN